MGNPATNARGAALGDGRREREGPKSLQAAGLGGAGGGAIAAVVFYVLLQFGLVGPAAKTAAIEAERRMTRVETRLDSFESTLNQMRDQVLAEIRGLRADGGARRASP